MQEALQSAELRKFMAVEESAYRQKSRIQWLKLGVNNNHFFFHSMKERFVRNSIEVFYDDNGVKLFENDDIQNEVLEFYKKLLGRAASSLAGMDIPIIRNGRQVSPAAARDLIAPVTTEEIDNALKSIDDNKAPGIDGYNSFFFKKVWVNIKSQVYQAIWNFFDSGVFPASINYTLITLVPKVANPSSVKEYRPIACCTVLYKIIAKILTLRLQKVVGDIIDLAQVGFMPNRSISDNILLATELIKGYATKNISPRCMVKIDLRKAYDSVEWPYLFTLLNELGFPLQFVNWIKTCVTSVSYTVLINGIPSRPFAAKKRA